VIVPFSPFKLLIDEDLSPKIAQVIPAKFGIETVHIRDRGLTTRRDLEIFQYAYDKGFILVTANIKDFETLAKATELHEGLVFLRDGQLLRDEQIEVLILVVTALIKEINNGNDMINRVLYVERDKSLRFESMP
jgi:predicted nuclease of predicted toxin-antitoxin system